MKRSSILLVLPMILLAACASLATVTETPIIATLSLQPSQSETQTPKNTETRQATPRLYPTTPAIATETTIIKQYCNRQDYPYARGFLPTKSRKLMAFVCWSTDDKDISITKVIALDGSHTPIDVSYRKDYLKIDYTQPLPERITEDLQMWIENYALYPVHWTADEKFLYMERVGTGDGGQYKRAFALMRLNIETGKIAPVLPPIGAYDYDFSADGTKLLSVDQSKSPMIVKVENLVTGKSIEIPMDARFNEAGYLMLSPDGTKLVVSAIDYEQGISIILIDLASMSQKYLAKDVKGEYFPLSWIDNQTIYGWQPVSGMQEWQYFYMDITSKKTSPAPTPTLIPTSTP